MRFAFRSILAAAVLFAGSAGFASAQDFPARPITVIVPFAAGGPTDVIARIVADHMSKTLGQTLVIENAVGAGGTTASMVAYFPPVSTPVARKRYTSPTTAITRPSPG